MIRPPVVVKVGGSLLDWPELPSRLRSFLESLGGERVVLVVGGGGVADEIRRLDRVHQLGEEAAHRLALRSLDLTSHILASLLGEVRVVRTINDLGPVWSSGRVPALAPREFLEEDERSPEPLPHTWGVTTDSIAARLAVRLGSERLVLLKSIGLPGGCGLEAAVRLGYVDATLPHSIRGLRRVEAKDLRSSGESTQVWEVG